MKSFALWCDAKNAGESTGVKVLMNFNLWAEAEKGESHTVLDVGVMLIPEEKSSKRKQICEVVKSISFYCPFPLEKKNFENLFPKMDNKTVGAIFNSPCNYTKNDIYSVGYVTLYGDDAYPKFAICSCDNVQFEEIGAVRKAHLPGASAHVNPMSRHIAACSPKPALRMRRLGILRMGILGTQ